MEIKIGVGQDFDPEGYELDEEGNIKGEKELIPDEEERNRVTAELLKKQLEEMLRNKENKKES